MRWSLRYAALLIRIQWIDRSATSSFLIGITVQTAILSASIAQMGAESPTAVLQAALRADLLVGLALCSLSAMSAFQNEFRFQTVWQTARDPRSLRRLMLARALGMVVVTMPALCVPFAVASFTLRGAALSATVLMLLSVALVLTAFTHILTLALAVAYDPARVVPWIRQITMASLVGTVTFLSPAFIRQLFPFYWIEQMPATDSAWPVVWVLTTTLVLWVGCVLALRRPSGTVIASRLTDNVEAR